MYPHRPKDFYANGTWVDQAHTLVRGRFGRMGRFGRARCSDGKIRGIRAHKALDERRTEAQTRVNGITIHGWVEVEDGELRFHARQDGKNAGLLPRP